MSSTYYLSREWQQFKTFIRELAGDTCEFCQIRSNRHLHHIVYDRFEAEYPADVMLICEICHAMQHDLYNGLLPECKPGSPFDERLHGYELQQYILERREQQWIECKERLELQQEVIGTGGEIIALGEQYFARCQNGLP